jgi:hypothetical protein
MLREEALNVIAVDGGTAVVAEIVAQRPSAAKRPEDCGTENIAT